jgi:alpha-N-arabinofuranosidase
MIDVELRLGERLRADVSPGLFGGFVEHFGRGLYGGVWDLAGGHVRADVQAAARGMGVTNLRYPGGCFADSYHWRDGVGPPAERPTYERTYWTDLHLHGIDIDPAFAAKLGPRETNAFGTDEFLRYCNDVGAEPLLTVNFGTGTPEEAADWVRYTNRRADSPRSVRWWFVGNEIDEPSELGHCPPHEYGRRFREFAGAMREVDPEVRVIAVGRCVPAGGEGWNEGVLRGAGDAVDMISLHYYFPSYGLGRDLAENEEEFRQLLAGARTLGEGMDWALGELDAARPEEPLPVALDEWSLWSAWDDLLARNHRLCDSVYFGGCLNRMIERSERVRFAMISHLVNCLAPIQTSEDRMHVTAAYLTLRLYRSAVRRHRVALEVEAPMLDVVPLPGRSHNKPLGGTTSDMRRVPAVDAVATGDDSGTALLVCSGTLDEPIRATIHGLPSRARGRARWITGPDPFARNEFDAPATLGYAQADVTADASGSCTLDLQPATVTAVEVG